MSEFEFVAAEYLPVLIAAELMDLTIETARAKGWLPAVGEPDMHGRNLLCEISLTRPVGPAFGEEHLGRIAEGIGIVDKESGQIKEQYRLGLEFPRKSKLMSQLGD